MFQLGLNINVRLYQLTSDFKFDFKYVTALNNKYLKRGDLIGQSMLLLCSNRIVSHKK